MFLIFFGILVCFFVFFFFFQAEDGIRDGTVTGVQTCALPISLADGRTVSLRKPSYRLVDPGYGPLDPATLLSPRRPPSLAGAGLLERIDAATDRKSVV